MTILILNLILQIKNFLELFIVNYYYKKEMVTRKGSIVLRSFEDMKKSEIFKNHNEFVRLSLEKKNLQTSFWEHVHDTNFLTETFKIIFILLAIYCFFLYFNRTGGSDNIPIPNLEDNILETLINEQVLAYCEHIPEALNRLAFIRKDLVRLIECQKTGITCYSPDTVAVIIQYILENAGKGG